MNESQQFHAVIKRHADVDHSVLAELMARHWKQDRCHFTLQERSHRAQLEASWWRQPGIGAMELHWFRRAWGVAQAHRLPPTQVALDGAA